jgi:dipeptidyl-peptidase 4
VWRWTEAHGMGRLTFVPGVHSAAAGGATVVVRSAGLGHDGTRTWVLGGGALASHAETPLVRPNVTLSRGGERRLATAVLLPADAAADARLPVLLDPYGGPHAQRVLAARDQYLTSQWFADQGFAVVVIDGRGTPGRGSAWERGVHLDLAGPVLEDQVAGLHAAAEADRRLDLTRVAIRGWSFGGYLAALAVLRRPDVFHAAVAGAPVTEWRLYDTHYTERYLGNPNTDPAPYDRSSLLADAPRLERPLLLVHGLADDNVVAAHTLQLSSALLAAGRPHQVLPLSGVTHMTPQEVVAENLLLLQLDFLRAALGLPVGGSR